MVPPPQQLPAAGGPPMLHISTIHMFSGVCVLRDMQILCVHVMQAPQQLPAAGCDISTIHMLPGVCST
jgi:hypothetical protein